MSQDREWRSALGDDLSQGDVVAGKYRLERIIGAGGIGVVTEAWHLDLEQKVAIKLLHPARSAKERTRQRFRREGRAGFAMRSEHVARVLDMGTTDSGVQYLAMELLDGHSFAELLHARGPLPHAVAVGYVLQICEALAEAHALHLIHRDLKPENLFLTHRADGSPCVKVLDFGLAKVQDAGDALTRVGRGMGTPRYMSPEQWVSARDVGPATDLWSLGVVLFELLTGQCPFDEPDVNDLCQSILFQPAPRLSTLLPTLPPGLDAAIDRCLQKKPRERCPSVAELATALLPYARGLPDEVSGELRASHQPVAAVRSPWEPTSSHPQLDDADPSPSARDRTEPSGPRAPAAARAVTPSESSPAAGAAAERGSTSDPAAGDRASAAPPGVEAGGPPDTITIEQSSDPGDEGGTVREPRLALPALRSQINTVPLDLPAEQAPATRVMRRWRWRYWPARRRAIVLGAAAISTGALLGLLTLPGRRPGSADRTRRADAVPAACAAPGTGRAGSALGPGLDASTPPAASSSAEQGTTSPSASPSATTRRHRSRRRPGDAASSSEHGRKWVPPAL